MSRRKRRAAAQQAQRQQVQQMQAQEQRAVAPMTSSDRFNGRGDLTHPGYRYTRHDGEKYEGGLGPVELLLTDYWSLRRRSVTFFKKNMYARGIIRRLVTNIVNTGLVLSSAPITDMIPLDEDQTDAWAEGVDKRFKAWGDIPEVCDFSKRYTFGQFQRVVKREALISGDVLVVEHHNRKTNLPSYQLIDGSLIQTPYQVQDKIAQGNTVDNGVEMNESGEHVAFWMVQKNFEYKRFKAVGANGRRIAWLYYGTDKRHGEARGEPLLTLVMQSISEIDKYRDAAQRKATVGAQIVAFVQSQVGSNSISSKPFSAGAQRRVQGEQFEGDGTTRTTNIAEMGPGIVVENLPDGKEVKGFTNDTTDEKFGEFELAILEGVSWTLGLPVSVLRMHFDSSYSASRGEIKEFESVINEMRDTDADNLLRPIYRSWLKASVLTGRIGAPGFLPASRDPMQFDTFAAWTNSEWYGMVKEAVDLGKEVDGRKGQIDIGALTYSKASRMLTGTDFKTNVRKNTRENALLAESIRPMLELRQEFGDEEVDQVLATSGRTLIEGHNNA